MLLRAGVREDVERATERAGEGWYEAVGGKVSARGVVRDAEDEESGRREGCGGGRTPSRSSLEREDWRRLGGGVKVGGRRSL